MLSTNNTCSTNRYKRIIDTEKIQIFKKIKCQLVITTL